MPIVCEVHTAQEAHKGRNKYTYMQQKLPNQSCIKKNTKICAFTNTYTQLMGVEYEVRQGDREQSRAGALQLISVDKLLFNMTTADASPTTII